MKTKIENLVAEGALEEAITVLQQFVQELGIPDASAEAKLLAARWAENQKKERMNTHEPADIGREYNSIGAAIFALLQTLPDEVRPAPKKRGIGEQNMKFHIFLLIMFVKFAIIVWLFTLWQSQGFSADQFSGTLSLLLPVLATYGGLMFQDFLDHRHVTVDDEIRDNRRIKRSVQWVIYLVIIGYGLALLLTINAKAYGSLSYAQLAGAFAIIESALGIYLSRVVRTFFPNKTTIS